MTESGRPELRVNLYGTFQLYGVKNWTSQKKKKLNFFVKF